MAIGVVAMVLGTTAVATAMWTVRGTEAVSIATGALDQGGIRPTLRTAAGEVTNSWTQLVLDGHRLGAYGDGGYLVRRYDAAGRRAAIGGSCVGRVTGGAAAVGCREGEVPAGTWSYAITPVIGRWTGAEGPRRAVTVRAGEPTITVDSPADGATLGEQRPPLAGNTTKGSGDVPEVTAILMTGRAPNRVVAWLHAKVSDGRWTTRPTRDLPDGNYTLLVRQHSPAGGIGSHSRSSFLVDATAPVTVDDSAAIGTTWARGPSTLTLSPADRDGSGVRATYFTTDGSIPTAHSNSGTTVEVGADGSHAVRYFSVDNAGNREAVRTAGPIRIDRTAPQAAALDPLPAVIRTGQVLTAVAEDALSGVLRVVYERCASEACSIWTPIGSSAVGPTYQVVWSRQPADGTYSLRARVFDAAGNVAASNPVTVRVDNSLPSRSTTGNDGRVDDGATTSTLVLLHNGQ